jgi:hypothetical protein
MSINLVLSRVTRFGNFSPIRLHLKAHYDFMTKWSSSPKWQNFGLLCTTAILKIFKIISNLKTWFVAHIFRLQTWFDVDDSDLKIKLRCKYFGSETVFAFFSNWVSFLSHLLTLEIYAAEVGQEVTNLA